MKIPSNLIKEYLLSKFKEYTISHDEFLVNSIFTPDSKKHLSINMESGLWQCFKTKEKGSIVHLVSLMEGISYFEALTLFNRKLLDSPELLFVESKEIRQEHIRRGYRTIIEETKNFKKLSEASRYSDLVSERLAYKFVQYRGLEHQTFYVGTKGKFVNRLIIPFSWNNNMEYFQARLLTDYGMKYLNPSSKEY